MDRFVRRWPALACALAVSPVLASGFARTEQAGEAAALGGAWVARADEAAAVWYNPAALVRSEGTQVQVGAAVIWGEADLRTGDPAWGLDPAAPATFDSEGETLLPLHLYASQRIGQRWAWGVGLNRPFGFATEWRERPVTFSSKSAELGTYRLTASAAWAINDVWSIGGGLGYLRADLKALSREVRVNLDNDPDTFEAIGESELSGDGGSLGFDLAALYSTRGFSAGVVYRSGISPTLDGDLRFRSFGPAEPLFPDTPAEVELDLPAQLTGGVSWGAADTWQFELGVSWTQWSGFDALPLDAVEETPPFVTDTGLRQDWDDAIGYHLGVSWEFDEGHEARVGLLQDQSPLPNDTRRPTIVDSDSLGVSVGYGFDGPDWTVDAFARAVFFADKDANGDPGEGILDGRYSSMALALGATLTWRF